MPSKRVSSARVDYVPALCTHRPSLLPIEWLSEAFGLARGGWQRPPQAGKLYELGHLEEVKVVTRLIFPHSRPGALKSSWKQWLNDGKQHQPYVLVDFGRRHFRIDGELLKPFTPSQRGKPAGGLRETSGYGNR